MQSVYSLVPADRALFICYHHRSTFAHEAYIDIKLGNLITCGKIQKNLGTDPILKWVIVIIRLLWVIYQDTRCGKRGGALNPTNVFDCFRSVIAQFEHVKI